ncbi:alpha/beta hydrolase family protein [Rhodococcus sp. NPDC078407]|uniref:alpha/beta hydrolase family protein n=1 Tax=Rhodococcus sp. NPDC078407 TaxID=3364509 RepID=UPI0037C8538D
MNRRHFLSGLLTVALVGCTSTDTDSSPNTAETYSPAVQPVSGPAGDPVRLKYGYQSDNIGDLYLPDNDATSLPVVVMIHGGGWQQDLDLSYFRQMAAAIADEGIAVWNVEYRRGPDNWANTLTDVDDATEALATVVQDAAGGRLDLNRVHVTGHSAGGQLAAWVAARHLMPVDAPGAEPKIRPRSATIMAGVFDMKRAVTLGGDKFVPVFLGGMPNQVPGRYKIASPIEYLPLDIPVTALHGDADRTVSVNQSRVYVDAATKAGSTDAELVVLPGAGHGSFLDPTDRAWSTTLSTITGRAQTLL